MHCDASTVGHCGSLFTNVVVVSLCLLVTAMSPAKTAEPIEMLFGMKTQMGPGNHVLDRGPHPPMGIDNFRGHMPVPAY